MKNMTSQLTSERRIVFVDIDGTLVNHGSPVLDSARDAVREARRNGHLVFIATGRGEADVQPEIREIGFDGEITNSGALAHIGNETVLSRPMEVADMQFLINYFEGRGIPFLVQTHDQTYTTEAAKAVMLAYDAYLREQLTPGNELEEVHTFANFAAGFPDISEADLTHAAKLVFISEADLDMQVIARDIGDRFHLVPGSMPVSVGSNGEISPRGINKGSAITEVLQRLDIPAQNAVGIGDSWNDVEMFSICGEAVAMAGADEGVKKYADHITGSVEEGGLAQAFARLGLISASVPG